MFISKGSYGYGEIKNAFALSVQITHWTLRTSNLYRVSWNAYSATNGNLEKFWATNTHGTVFALSRCLYQKEATGMERLKIHSLCRIKERIGCYESPKYTRLHASPYKAANGNLVKFEATNTIGTVFALSRCLYQKEATGMERLKMHSLCRCK